MTLALDLALRGQSVVLLDDANRIGEGSRAICFSKRSLEVWDRLGVATPMVEKGVIWNVGRIFRGDSLLYQFNLLPEPGHKMPAFINLQQYHAEAFLVERAQQLAAIDLRWSNKVTALEPRNDHVLLRSIRPTGIYNVAASYVVACDGARSNLRAMARRGFRWADLRGSIPDRRREDDPRPSRPSAGSGSIRRFMRGSQRCCIASPTTSGGSIFSLAATPTPRLNVCRKTCGPVSPRCWATMRSPSNGSRSTNFNVEGCRTLCMAGSSSQATLPIRSRRSARGARIAGIEDAENLDGSWQWWCVVQRRRRCLRAMISSAEPLPTKTSASLRARPIHGAPDGAGGAHAARCCRWPMRPNSVSA